MIKKEGDQYVLYTKDGSKKLGTHDSQADAEKQEAAIEASKARAASRKKLKDAAAQEERFRSLLAKLDPAVLAGADEIPTDDKDNHPFTYCMNHVVPAIEAKEGAMEDPDAFCGWWKSERDFTAAQKALQGKESRQVHLVGATGQIRTAMYDNREHLVVPVVALMEGVIHAINAETPEYVPLSCLSVAPQGWDGRPVVLGHPVKNGRQISANAPGVLESQGFGTIFGSRIEGKKLMLEAWIDPVKATKIGAHEMLNNIRNNRMCEVSVGAFVVADSAAGVYGDKPYKAVWRDIVPDHLAFLPKGIGACSIEMGCGSPRAATAHMLSDAELIVLGPLPDRSEIDDADPDELDDMADQAEDDGDDETAMLLRRKAMRMRASQRRTLRAASAKQPDRTCYTTLRQLLDQTSETWEGASEIVNGLIATPDDAKSTDDIERTGIESLNVLTLSMYSSLNAISSLIAAHTGKNGERYLQGARHSATDREIIQKVHDHTVDLGADCPGKQRYAAAAPETPATETPATETPATPLPAEPCGCADGTPVSSDATSESKGESMTKEQRADLIKTLVGDKHSGFAVGDEKMLEAASDERLDAFRVAAAARAKEVEKPAPTTAEVKPMTEDDFMRLAPESLRTLIARQQTTDVNHKAQLVADLKAAQSEYSESELSAMPLDNLERLARIAGLQTEPQPVSYAGRPIPRVAESRDTNVFTNPPDPYEAGLKALRAATTVQ